MSLFTNLFLIDINWSVIFYWIYSSYWIYGLHFFILYRTVLFQLEKNVTEPCRTNVYRHIKGLQPIGGLYINCMSVIVTNTIRICLFMSSRTWCLTVCATYIISDSQIISDHIQYRSHHVNWIEMIKYSKFTPNTRLDHDMVQNVWCWLWT